MDDGRVLRVGETFESWQLQAVNWETRECVFANGKRLRLGEALTHD